MQQTGSKLQQPQAKQSL